MKCDHGRVADDIAASAAKIAARALEARSMGDLVAAKFLASQAAMALSYAKALGWKADLQINKPD
jgi:hypothetical protein